MCSNKEQLIGVAVCCLGIGVLLASFFSPWLVIGLLCILVIVGGLFLLLSR